MKQGRQLNDGYEDQVYALVADPERNQELSRLLNELCHVFRRHKEGVWKSSDKDAYAKALAKEIKRTPSLIRKLLKTGDRAVMNVTHRAVELLKEGKEA